MKIQYLAEIVSEFSGFHHTPSFKASRSTGDFTYSSTKNSRRASTDSNHSIHIPIGVDDVPILPASRPHFVKHLNSSPSISRVASLSPVQEKVQRKLKRSKSLESLETNDNSRKLSYRLLV